MNVSALMNGYFKEDARPKKMLVETLQPSVPIVVPSEKKWEMLERPEVLQRLFRFSQPQDMLFFVEDVIQLQEQMNHHGRILIDHLQVLIQISTKVLDRVTDLDVEYANKVDEIYADVRAK